MRNKCLMKLKLQNRKLREVPPFSIQSLQNDTVVQPPPKADPYKIRPIKKTLFRRYLDNGDIPIMNRSEVNAPRQTRKNKKKNSRLSLEWSVPIAELDYCYYFPIIIEGLGDSDDNVRFIAESAAKEMIEFNPNKILPTVPLIILPIKKAMNTRNPDIIIAILKIIQLMVKNGPCVGQALVPYFRQILPVCNLFKHFNVNLLDGVDEERDKRIGDVIEDTLQLLEICGGRDAYINIKYVIPTYESYVMN